MEDDSLVHVGYSVRKSEAVLSHKSSGVVHLVGVALRRMKQSVGGSCKSLRHGVEQERGKRGGSEFAFCFLFGRRMFRLDFALLANHKVDYAWACA